MSSRNWIVGAVLVALIASSPLKAEENRVVGRIQGYAEVADAMAETSDGNLVLLQTLMRDLDRTGDAMETEINSMSERAFQAFVGQIENEELREKVQKLESKAARAEVVQAVRRDILGKKMALYDRLSEMSPEEAKAAIRDLLTTVESPENSQAFTKEFASKIGTFFGKVGGFITGHALFGTVSTVTIAGAGPFLVVVKILSTAGKGAYIGWQYTKEFRYGLRKGIKEGWKNVRSVLEGEETKLASR